MLLGRSPIGTGARQSFIAAKSIPAFPTNSHPSITQRLAKNTRGPREAGIVHAVTEEERVTNGANPSQELKDAIQAEGDLSPEEQQALGRIYQFLVQGRGPAGLNANITLQRLLETYQVLLWRPAELLNGRLAMIGFTAGATRQFLTGETVWSQVASTGGFAYLFAYGIVLLAGFLNKQYGSPTKGVGPFTPTAELINGRAAMVGYFVLGYIGYNQELTRTIVSLATQLAQSASFPGVTP